MLSPVDDYSYPTKNKKDGNEGGSENFDTNIHLCIQKLWHTTKHVKNKIQLRVSCVL